MNRAGPTALIVCVLLWAGAGGALAQEQDAPGQAPPAVRAGNPAGASQFEVFCDIEDDACGRLVVVLRAVLDAHADAAGVTFRHLVSADHARAETAYRAVLAAAKQGRGWDMLDLACANPDRLDEAGLQSMAAQLGLAVDRVAADAEGAEARLAAEQDAREAAARALGPGPAVFLNGARLDGPFTVDSLAAAIRKQ